MVFNRNCEKRTGFVGTCKRYHTWQLFATKMWQLDEKKAHFDRLTGSFVVTVLLSKDILFAQLVSKYVSFHETLPTVTSPYSDTRHVTHAIEKSAERT